ncbi:flagellar biosynthetic protein FliO [Sporosarcina sp. Te-1]|uniref:flagellar biosynthetic protein FliO n=1 Tax=Sporosarcina sp. Te-1 TaxID=2818390 RepID=UPI001A9E2368|nr:flagellar biosynthetic protein FliO [Sporosarcina sp. Te-1]QTD42317.1 flagellar biosynthetic protein FliO [Sporosarcina sp. Te-1]
MKKSVIFRLLSALLLVAIVLISNESSTVKAASDSSKFVSDYYGKDAGQDEKPDTENEMPAADRPDDGAAVGLSWLDYGKTLFAFVFVIGLLFALLKFINRKNKAYQSNKLMKNLGGLALGQQKSIQLVSIGDSYYIVGVGENVELLKEITDPEEIARLQNYFQDGGELPEEGLLERLFSKVAKKEVRPASNEERDEHHFGQIFSARIEELNAERRQHMKRLEEKESRKDE